MEDENYTYDYFISYRRACGGALEARHVKSILCKYGKTAFLDVDDIKAGEYKPQIFNAIENSKKFILILNEESWREYEQIDVYYEEIIRITQQSGDIVPIEFAKGVLNNVPDILQARLNRNIKKFEKVSYSHDEHFLFEKLLCDKLGLPYSPDDKTENLPQFTMPFEIEEDDLIKRDERVKALSDEVISHSVFNLVGIGGSGKTTLTYLLTDKYKHFFSNIAYVVVNGNIKEDFVAQINSTLNFDFAPNVPTDEKYKTIISFMDKYKIVNNLLILDVNETADKTAIEDYAKKLKNNTLPTNKIYPNGWNILILSREKFGDFNNKNLSDDVDKEFLKELFLKKAGISEDDFDDYDGLFELIKYSPLLAEQLGIYFEYQPIPSLEEIRGILYGDLREEAIQGTNAHNRDERTLITFLKNLIDYQKFNDDEKTVLRHFVLWKSEYISINIISDLLKDTCHNLNKALGSLAKRSILNFDKKDNVAYYKLHGLLADSIREQIDVTKQDYETYIKNVIRICHYDFRNFLQYADYIGNSLCKYEITTNYFILNQIAILFADGWEYSYAKKLFGNIIYITKQKLKKNQGDIEPLNYLAHTYNNLARLQATIFNDYESSIANISESIKIREKISQILKTPESLNMLADVYNNLANLQDEHLHDYKSAEINYKKIIEIREKIKNNSDNPDFYNDLTSSYYNLAVLQQNKLNDYDAAEWNYNTAIVIGEKLNHQITNVSYLNQLAIIYGGLASLYAQQKKYTCAIDNCIKTIQIFERIKYIRLDYYVGWIISKHLLAQIYIESYDLTNSTSLINEIKPIIMDLLEKYPNNYKLIDLNERIKYTESVLNNLAKL